jgi:hypothetical protein
MPEFYEHYYYNEFRFKTKKLFKKGLKKTRVYRSTKKVKFYLRAKVQYLLGSFYNSKNAFETNASHYYLLFLLFI